MKKFPFIKQFNWRALLMRVLINAAALTVIALILPNIRFIEITVWNILFIAIALGVLNAIIKPILQFLTLSFIFTTYGLVVVLINAVILWLLAFLFPDRFSVDSILAALIGGALVGILGSFFESLLGLSLPIVPDEQAELRKQSGDQTQVVTKMILKRDQEEVGLADPAAPLLVGHPNGLAAEGDLPPLEHLPEEEMLVELADQTSPPLPPDIALEVEEPEEQEVAEDGSVTEEEPAVPDADTESVESPDLLVETSEDIQNETPAQAEENESWQ